MKKIVFILLCLSIFLFGSDDKKLLKAVIQNKTDQAISLLEQGNDPFCYGDESSIRKIVTPYLKTIYIGGIEKKAYPLVVLAAANGNTKIIQALYKKDKKSIFLLDKDKNDALMWAAREGKIEVVKLLLKYGFDPLYKASKTTAYDLALRFEHYDILKLFIHKLLKEKKYEKLSYTIWALARDKENIVEMLVQAGVKDTYKGIHPRTTLTKVAETNNIKRFALLVKYGSDPYEGNTNIYYKGYNPLIASIIHNKQEMFLYLIDHFNYDLSKKYYDYNLLEVAYNYDVRADKKIIKKLLQKGNFDINKKNKDFKTLLDIAVEKKDLEYVKFFISLGCSLKTIDKALKIALKNHQKVIYNVLKTTKENFNKQ